MTMETIPAMESAAAPMASSQPGARPFRVPPLREDIRLMQGPPSRDGAPTWTLYDPALHRYLRVGRLEFEILVRWGLGRPASIADSVCAATTMRATEADVLDVMRFAQRGRLLQAIGPTAAKNLAAEANARRLSPAMWLLKNYLFIRVRLVDPDRFLASAVRLLAFLFTPTFAGVLLCLALLGFYLIGRQWESYTHSFLHLFSLEGAAEVGVALAFAKAIHEFGHGLMAKRLGCRVPGMGVALLVMWPMLWTDVTDSWRLTGRYQRLLIDAAGVIAELMLAVAASLAWSILPDGPSRSAAFLLSGSTWLITLAVNVNPLMRFDGYFLLSDWLEEPNLQERSFAMARWRLRELLFALGDPAPEVLRPARQRLLVGYAIACWIYRLGLFLGIAVLVYHLTFKLLGLFLMAVEVGWFIVRPVMAELATWPRRVRSGGMPVRVWLTVAVFAAGVAAVVVPWRGSVFAPGLLRAERQIAVITPEPGRLAKVSANGDRVAAGQTLFTLDNPDTEHAEASARVEIAGLKARLLGQSFDSMAAQDVPVAWQQLEGALARLRDAQAREAQMVVRAPFAGRLLDVPRDLEPGIWLPKREQLGILADPSAMMVEALVNEADIARVKPGDTARFRPENGEDTVRLVVRDVSPGAAPLLDTPELASIHGGGVPVRREADGRLKPEAAVYRVTFGLPDGTPAAFGIRRGTVRIDAAPVSLAGGLWRRAAAVVMREAGF
jgi:putative peptide zinc metalloprotease protein